MNRNESVEKLVEEKLPIFTKASDQIWDYAELMFQEKKSSALHAEIMQEQGFKVERGVAGMETALLASYGSGHPVVAILGVCPVTAAATICSAAARWQPARRSRTICRPIICPARSATTAAPRRRAAPERAS